MFKNFVWDFIGKFSGQLVSFLISIVLTRLLTPAEFGIMGMALVVISIAALFLDLGFSRAIIQQKEVSQLQYSTVFYTNLAIAILLTFICIIIAKPISQFYHQPLITPVFRVLSISFILGALNIIPLGILYRRMKFKVITGIAVSSSIASGIIGVLLAYKGFGVWALVIQSLCNSFLTFLLCFLYLRWLPSFAFNLSSVKPLWQFGSRLFGAGFLDVLFTKMDTFIIGRLFPPATLGFYTRAQSMDTLVKNLSSQSIMSVLFPYIARNQDNRPYLSQLFKKYLNYILFFSIAISGCLYVIAKPLFVLLFTEKWIFSAELFQLLAIVGFAWPVSSLIVSIIEGLGNSKAFFRLEVLKKIVFLPIYLFGFFLGLKGFLFFFIIGNLVAVYLNVFFVSKEIEATKGYQVKLITIYLLNALIAVLVVYLTSHYFHFSLNILQIIFNSTAFLVVFILLCRLCKAEGLEVFNIGYKKVKLVLGDKRN